MSRAGGTQRKSEFHHTGGILRRLIRRPELLVGGTPRMSRIGTGTSKRLLKALRSSSTLVGPVDKALVSLQALPSGALMHRQVTKQAALRSLPPHITAV